MTKQSEPVGGSDRCLLIRSFRGTKAGAIPSHHRKPYKPKSNRAPSSKKPEALFEPLTSCPETEYSRRSGKAHSGFAAAAAFLSSSNFTAGQKPGRSAVHNNHEVREI